MSLPHELSPSRSGQRRSSVHSPQVGLTTAVRTRVVSHADAPASRVCEGGKYAGDLHHDEEGNPESDGRRRGAQVRGRRAAHDGMKVSLQLAVCAIRACAWR
eukprot:scaffold94231_cov28-Tisochrysis_lutea.AAC.4